MPHINKQMASFFLTTRCNLRCVYCYNSKERATLKEQTLPLHIAKAGVDYFFANNPSRHIRFYGPGEPTQEMPRLKEIVEYAKEKSGDKLTVEIQTNGCFDKSAREWLLNNINIFWISFDGEPDIQNANRPLPNSKPSAPIIEDNVRWLIDNSVGKSVMVGARVTITDANMTRQKQIVNYFNSLGIDNVWTDPLFPSVDKTPVCDDVEKLSSFNFNMDSYLDNYIDAYKYAKSKNLFYGSFLACNFDGVCSRHCRACTPVPHFTPDGYVSACDMVTFGSNPHHMSAFVYGKWNEETQKFDFDEEKIRRLQNRSVQNMLHCQKCEVREHCGGYCLGEVTNEIGDMYGQKVMACKAIRRLYKEIGTIEKPFSYMHP